MNIRPMFAAIALAGTLAVPNIASAAQLAFVAGSTSMRAGPSAQFPVVARVLGGSSINVFGCVRGYSWCDASVRGVRGWVNASRLEFVYGGRRVLVPQYYTYFRAPVVSFNFGYWDRYYASRPFYVERHRYFPGQFREGDRYWREGDRRDHGRDRDGRDMNHGGKDRGDQMGGRDRDRDGRDMNHGGKDRGDQMGGRNRDRGGRDMDPSRNGGDQMGGGRKRDRNRGGDDMQQGGNGGGDQMGGGGRDRGGKGGNRQRCPDGECAAQ